MEVKYKCLKPVAVPSVSGTKLPIFRCGKCPNCLRAKANELSVRAIRECKGHSLAWITLTYDNDHCPICHTIDVVDPESGEYKTRTYIDRDPSFFKSAPFDYVHSKKCSKPIRRFRPLISFRNLYDAEVNPILEIHTRYMTIDMRDVQLFFKRFREHFGKGNCLENKYLCVPEYGGAGYRPHYHLMLLSPSSDEIGYIVNEWNNGHVDVDLSTSLATARKVSVYVSKYATKGLYDCPYISQGLCKKPKRATSVGFGVGDFQELKDRLLSMTDIVDPWFIDDCPPEITDYMLVQLQKNRAYKIADETSGKIYNYPFPRYLLDKVFRKRVRCVRYKLVEDSDLPLKSRCFQDDHYEYAFFPMEDKVSYKQFINKLKSDLIVYETKYKVISSPLQNEITNYLLFDLVDNALREQEQNLRYIQSCGLPVAQVTDFSSYDSLAYESAEKQFRSEIINNSIF